MRTITCVLVAVALLCGTGHGYARQQQSQMAAERDALDKAEAALLKELGAGILSITRTNENARTILVVELAPPPQVESAVPRPKPRIGAAVAASKSAAKSESSALDKELRKPKPPEAKQWYTEKFKRAAETVRNIPVRVTPIKNPSGKVDGALIKVEWKFSTK